MGKYTSRIFKESHDKIKIGNMYFYMYMYMYNVSTHAYMYNQDSGAHKPPYGLLVQCTCIYMNMHCMFGKVHVTIATRFYIL